MIKKISMRENFSIQNFTQPPEPSSFGGSNGRYCEFHGAAGCGGTFAFQIDAIGIAPYGLTSGKGGGVQSCCTGAWDGNAVFGATGATKYFPFGGIAVGNALDFGLVATSCSEAELRYPSEYSLCGTYCRTGGWLWSVPDVLSLFQTVCGRSAMATPRASKRSYSMFKA